MLMTPSLYLQTWPLLWLPNSYILVGYLIRHLEFSVPFLASLHPQTCSFWSFPFLVNGHSSQRPPIASHLTQFQGHLNLCSSLHGPVLVLLSVIRDPCGAVTAVSREETVRRSVQKGKTGLGYFHSSLTGNFGPIESNKKLGLVFSLSF